MSDIEVQRLTYALQQLLPALQRITQLTPTTAAAAGPSTAVANVPDWAKDLNPKDVENVMTGVLNTHVGKLDSFVDKIHKNLQSIGQLGSTITSGLTGAGSVSSIVQSVVNGAPEIGLLALMMFGRGRQLTFDALGQQAAQTFKAVGDVGHETADRLSKDIQILSSKSMALAEDLKAVSKTFADAGISAEKAQAPLETGLDLPEGVAHNVENATLGFDKLYQLASGTSAKMSVEIMKNSNIALQDAVQEYNELSRASRESGMSQQGFLGSIMQVSAALRVQQADAMSLGDIHMRMKAGLQAQGMDAERAGDMAAKGMQNLADAINSMDPAMLAALGEDVAKGLGEGPLSQIQILERMKRGFKGEGGEAKAFGLTLMGMIKRAEEAAPEKTQEGLQHAIEGIYGLNAATTDALIAFKEDAKTMGIEAAALKHQNELTKTFADEALKTQAFQEKMNELIDSIGNLGSSLLTVLSSGFDSLVTVGRFTSDMINPRNWFHAAELNKGLSEQLKANDLASAQAMNLAAASVKSIGKNLLGLNKVALGLEEGPFDKVHKSLGAGTTTGPQSITEQVTDQIKQQLWNMAKMQVGIAPTLDINNSAPTSTYSTTGRVDSQTITVRDSSGATFDVNVCLRGMQSCEQAQ